MSAPAVVLCAPQLAENVGSAARAMANFALGDLRLASPRFSWPNARADALAAGAFEGPAAVQVSVHDGLEAALADLNFVLAATARPREVLKPVLFPHDAAAACAERVAAGESAGVVFGAEKSGLSNEELALADAVVTYPVNRAFSSLNLAQAVAVFAYEWGAREVTALPEGFDVDAPPAAAREELSGMLAHLEEELEAAGFFWPPARAERMKTNLRSMFARVGLTSQEVSTLRGAVKAIAEGPRRRARERRAREADAARAREPGDAPPKGRDGA